MAHQNNTATGWVGWVAFAALMLALVGVFHMIAGFVGLFQEDIYAVGQNAVWMFDYSQWGWIHILGGLLAFLAAGSLAAGHMFGRVIAVLVAMVSVVANMAFVPVYPVWSLMMATIGVLVIWAVTVHGDELKED
jgi:hypothetical protein